MNDNTKKSPKANLEDKKGMYWLLGLVIVLFIVYAAFEFVVTKTNKKETTISDDYVTMIDEKTLSTDLPKQSLLPFRAIDVQLRITNKSILDTMDFSKFFGQDFPTSLPDPTSTPIPIFQPEPSEIPKRFVDQMPEFKGGMEAFNLYLKKTIKYPDQCALMGITGTVLIEFVVEKDGTVSEAKVLVSVYPDLDTEALRVIKKSPKWNPGKQNGIPVRVYYQIPIKFTLN